MNNKVLGIVVAVLVLLGAGAFFVLGGDDDNGNNDSSQTSDDQNGDAGNIDNALGLDTAALDGPFQLTVSGTQDGEAINVGFLVDGNGNYSSEVTSGGQTAGIIYLDGVTYLQDPTSGEWLSYPADSQSAPSFDPSEFALSDSDVNELTTESTIEDLGEQPCSTGTCRVWREAPGLENETALVKIDTATNRLVEVEVTNNDTDEVTSIMYSYPGEVTIEAPEGATPFEIPEL